MPQKLQAVTETLQQEHLWQHIPKYAGHREQIDGDTKNLHLRNSNFSTNERGGGASSAVGREEKARGNLVETEVQGSMAPRGGKKHKNFPQRNGTPYIY